MWLIGKILACYALGPGLNSQHHLKSTETVTSKTMVLKSSVTKNSLFKMFTAHT